ncbi:oligosaccharide flippase family protein [Pseudoruegeria sp. HB172150]|uniref:oligosaccharide flippase family protein n=1 Tax=Pseudoruegeria sp. HB172150 TaxID=2721164 RepID=UPI001551D1D5|nr:oligosaccharide flippase family protein [Pseudoruegeria sp. HB172150]
MPTAELGRETTVRDAGSRSSRLAKVGLVLFVLTLVSYVLKYLVNLTLARNLPADRYGDLLLALRILGIAASLALVGTATSAKRFLAQYLRHHDNHDAAAFIRWNMRFVKWPFLACIAISFALAWAVAHMHLTGIKHIESYHLAVVMLSQAPFLAAILLVASYLQCSEHNIAGYLPLNIFRHLFFIMGWWMVLAVIGAEPTNLLLVSVALLISVLLLGMQFLYVRQRVPSLIEAWQTRTSGLDSEKAKTWRTASQRLMAASAVSLIIVSLDLIVLEFVAEDEAVVGYYGAVLAMVAIIPRLSDGPLRPVIPRISALIESAEGRQELQRLINGALKINLMTGLATWAILVVFGRTLLGHFGPDFVQAYPALVIATTAITAAMLVQPAPLLLTYGSGERRLMIVTLLEFATLLAAAVPLGLLYGMAGVAAGMLVSVAIKSVIAVWWARELGIRPLGLI